MNISKDGKTLYFSDEEIDSETNGEKKVFVTKRINGQESHVKAEKRKNIGKHLEDSTKQQDFEIDDDEIFSFNSEMVLGVNSSDEKEEKTKARRKKSKVQISILCPGPVDTNFNKVADVEFALKGLSSEYVAKYAINKFFKGKFYIVPGWKIKLARIGAKLAPASFVAKISYNMQKRKIR